MKKINILLVLLLLTVKISSQNSISDTLRLSEVLHQVMENYPALLKAQSNLQAADAQIELYKTSYLPDVYVSGSYSHIGPVSKITLGGLGTFQLYPEDNYGASVNVNQNIYDFGRTAKNVELGNQTKAMTALQIEQLKQNLSSGVMTLYYNIAFLQEAIKIKDEQLNNLNEHLQFIQKKASTGSATNYEILSTQVKISQIENQKLDIQSSLNVATAKLNSFLGNPSDSKINVSQQISYDEILPNTNKLLETAYNERPEIKIANQKQTISEAKLNLINTQNNPSLNFSASGGFKNGYVPELMKLKGNYVLGVGVKIPLFDANRSKYQKESIKFELDAEKQDVELSRRSINDDVIESSSQLKTAQEKVKQSRLMVKQAEDAYRLSVISFKAGSITNLELLDSSTALSESRLNLYKSEIDYTINLQKLKIAIGEKIY